MLCRREYIKYYKIIYKNQMIKKNGQLLISYVQYLFITLFVSRRFLTNFI